MAAVAIDDPNGPPKGLLLRVLDSLAEWLMRQELRIICRGQPCGGGSR